jgi:hypothetical protein
MRGSIAGKGIEKRHEFAFDGCLIRVGSHARVSERVAGLAFLGTSGVGLAKDHEADSQRRASCQHGGGQGESASDGYLSFHNRECSNVS